MLALNIYFCYAYFIGLFETIFSIHRIKYYTGTLSMCMCVCSVVSDTLWPYGLQPTSFLCPWNFPGKNTGVGYHFLFQGIFLTQRWNLLSYIGRQIFFLPLCHLGSPHRQFRKSYILFHIFNNKIMYKFLLEIQATYLENSPKTSI